MPKRCALDLVTSVSCLRGRLRASSKAKRWMRSTPARVNTATSVAASIGRPRCDPSAVARVFTLGVLANHHPVDVLAGRERALHAGQHARRAHVGVLVEALADRQPQSPQRHVVGDLLAAHRAEEDRVEALQLLQAALGNVVPVLQVELRAPGEMLDLEGEAAVALREGFERLEARGDDFGADAVPGDAGELVFAHSWFPLETPISADEGTPMAADKGYECREGNAAKRSRHSHPIFIHRRGSALSSAEIGVPRAQKTKRAPGGALQRTRRRAGKAYAATRRLYSCVRVSISMRSPVSQNAGTCTSKPVFNFAGFNTLPDVSPRTAGSV